MSWWQSNYRVQSRNRNVGLSIRVVVWGRATQAHADLSIKDKGFNHSQRIRIRPISSISLKKIIYSDKTSKDQKFVADNKEGWLCVGKMLYFAYLKRRKLFNVAWWKIQARCSSLYLHEPLSKSRRKGHLVFVFFWSPASGGSGNNLWQNSRTVCYTF